MNAPQKIAGFVFGLVVVFAAAFGFGAALGPEPGEVTAEHAQSHEGETAAEAQDVLAAEVPAGLSSTEDGYTVDLSETRVNAGRQVPLRFRITDANGAAVTRYVDSHEKQLHLIVVRRDMVGYQHVHPTLDGNGTWSVPVGLSGGDYRVFADFVPAGGEALTLGADLHVAGRYDPRPLAATTGTATVDGYTVVLSGAPTPNVSSPLTLSVSRNGKPVNDLQPYLGAYGHLVALRASDLAYLHVHPMGEPGDGITLAGPEIGFLTTFPSNGDYRLFLDFKHEDVVRTAEFTVSVGAGQESAGTVPAAEPGHGHGH
jgi:hypothetical protein